MAAPEATTTAPEAEQTRPPVDWVARSHQQALDHLAGIDTVADWHTVLTIAARLPGQPFVNHLLLAARRPEATYLASFDSWQQVGRAVNRGERATWLLDPRPDRHRTVAVFDIAQTSGKPVTIDPYPGLTVDELHDQLLEHAAATGYTITRGNTGDALTTRDLTQRAIALRDRLAAEREIPLLARELTLAHVLREAPSRAPTPGEQLYADSVAGILAAALNTATPPFTLPNISTDEREHVLYEAGRRATTTASRLLPGLDSPPQNDHTMLRQLADRAEQSRKQLRNLHDRARSSLNRHHTTGPASPSTITPTIPAPRTADASRDSSKAVEPATTPTPTNQTSPARTEPAQPDRDRLVAAHTEAANLYHQLLQDTTSPSAEAARTHLTERRLEAFIRDPRWQLGHAPNEWTVLTDHLREWGFSDTELEAAGLSFRARTGNLIDRFRGRLMFGQRDEHGDLVGFVGRLLDPDTRAPRYANSPASTLYNKSRVLYGLAEQADAFTNHGVRPTIVEGPTDVLAVDAASTPEHPLAAVAPVGTALTTEHMTTLATLVPSNRGILIALDADDAGQQAAAAAYPILARHTGLIRTASLTDPDNPNSTDPAEIHARYGPELLHDKLVTQTRPLADLIIDQHLAQWHEQLHDPIRHIDAARDIAQSIAQLPEHETARQAARLETKLQHADYDTINVAIANARAQGRGSASRRAKAADMSPQHQRAASARAMSGVPMVHDSGLEATSSSPAPPETLVHDTMKSQHGRSR